RCTQAPSDGQQTLANSLVLYANGSHLCYGIYNEAYAMQISGFMGTNLPVCSGGKVACCSRLPSSGDQSLGIFCGFPADGSHLLLGVNTDGLNIGGQVTVTSVSGPTGFVNVQQNGFQWFPKSFLQSDVYHLTVTGNPPNQHCAVMPPNNV